MPQDFLVKHFHYQIIIKYCNLELFSNLHMCQPLLCSPVKSSTMPAMSPVTSHHYHQTLSQDVPPPPPHHQQQQRFAEIDTSVPGHRSVINIQNELWQAKLKVDFKLRSLKIKYYCSFPYFMNLWTSKLLVSRFR